MIVVNIHSFFISRKKFLLPTLKASLCLLQRVLKCITKFYLEEKAEALLKETITVILESAGRVCTFEAHKDVKKELNGYFNTSCNELHYTLKKWFSNCFNKSFEVYGRRQWNYNVAVREMKVSMVYVNS